MATEDALEAMQKLAEETGLNLSDEGLADLSPGPRLPDEPAADQPQEAAAAPAAKTPAAPAAPATPAQPAAAPAAQPAPQQPQQTQEHMVPVKTLIEERREFQRLIEELRKPPKPAETPAAKPLPDPFLNPEEYARHIAGSLYEERVQQQLQPIFEQVRVQLANVNKAAAHATYTAAVVDQAVEEFDKEFQHNVAHPDPAKQAERLRVTTAPNPFAAVVEWKQRREMLDDPVAYRARLYAEFEAEKAAQAATAAGTAQPQSDPQAEAQPRNSAGQFAPAPKQPAAKPIPSLNRQGTSSGSVPLKPPDMSESGEEFAEAVINAKSRPEWASV